MFRCSLADVGQLRTARRWLMWAAVRVFGFPTVAISTVALAVTFMVFLVLLVLGSGPWDEVERALVSAFPTILAVVGLAWVIALGHNGLETIEPWSGNRKLRVSPAAICSMAGGSGIFVLACPIIVPVLVVTMLTRLAILVLDLMGDGICWMARFGRRRDRFTIYRLIPEVHLYGPPPMRTQVDAGPPETELPPDDGVRVIDRSQALKLGMPVRYANPDAEWVLGLIVNDDADYQVQAQVQKWIESRFEAP